MRVSMKVDYGVRALIDLAQHHGQGPVQTAEIATRQSVPEPYLDQLLTTLRKAGFIRSRRGPQGGHVLAIVPDDINLSMVINTLEGLSPPIDCIDGTLACTWSSHCVQQEVWKAIDQATHKVLDATTIGELAKRQKLREAGLTYYI